MSYKFNPFTGNLDYFEESESIVNDSAKFLVDDRVLAENISALKLVRAINESEIVLAEPTTYNESKVLGVTLQGGVTTDEVEVLLFGKLEDPSFNFPLNEPLFLTTNGTITDVPPVTGFSANIGYSLGLGAIFINVQEQVEL